MNNLILMSYQSALLVENVSHYLLPSAEMLYVGDWCGMQKGFVSIQFTVSPKGTFSLVNDFVSLMVYAVQTPEYTGQLKILIYWS